jgi:hypothetical protein
LISRTIDVTSMVSSEKIPDALTEEINMAKKKAAKKKTAKKKTKKKKK